MSQFVAQITILRKAIGSIEELVQFVKQLKIKQSTIILLSGPLGVGKTEMVKQYAKVHNCAGVASPSFSFHHQYKGDIEFDHWDLFRVKNDEDLESTGFWEHLQNSKNPVFIEWPEKMNLNYLPLGREIIKVELSRF